MRIGIFTSVFRRDTLAQRLAAVRELGLTCTQFNLSDVGLPSLPDVLDPAMCDDLRESFTTGQVEMSAINGTFNMIHPDPDQRRVGLAQLRTVADQCERLGTSLVTLCTGTRNPDHQWSPHPGNVLIDAWDDLLTTMEAALGIAERANVVLAFEPEVANVVDSALKARRLLDTFRSPHLKVVMDGANIFHSGELRHQKTMLAEAAELLGPDIVLAHAKDLLRDGAAGNVAAGTGLLDYHCYLSTLRSVGFTGPLILHGLSEKQAPASVAFLQGCLAQITSTP